MPRKENAEKIEARLMTAFIDSGADPDARNVLDLTPLMVLAISRGSAGDRASLAGTLVRAGANVNLSDDIGNTALIYAAQTGHAKIVALLLANGADATTHNQRGEDAATVAKSKGHLNIAEMLQNWSTRAARPSQ